MSPAAINREALIAGHDVLLFCVDVPGSISAIVQAVEEGKISEAEITRRCKKSLAMKQVLHISTDEAFRWEPEEAHRRSASIRLRVAQKALTWLKKPEKKLAWAGLDSFVLDMERSQENELAHHQLNFAGGKPYQKGKAWEAIIKEKRQLATQPLAVGREWIQGNKSIEGKQRLVLVHGIGIKAKNAFDMKATQLELLEAVLDLGHCWVVWQGSPYALQHVKNWKKAEAILLSYQEGEEFERVAAAVLLGEQTATGTLPISMGEAT